MPCSPSSALTAILAPRPLGTALRRDRRGTTAIEFALVALPLMALLIATLQITTTFFAQQLVETAAEGGARMLMTGTAQKNKLSAADFKTAVCKNLPGFMTCSRLMVDVTIASDYSKVNTNAPVITLDKDGNPTIATAFSPGNPGDIVVMKTMYIWDVQAGPLGFDISTFSRGKRLLMSTAVFKTENYA